MKGRVSLLAMKASLSNIYENGKKARLYPSWGKDESFHLYGTKKKESEWSGFMRSILKCSWKAQSWLYVLTIESYPWQPWTPPLATAKAVNPTCSEPHLQQQRRPWTQKTEMDAGWKEIDGWKKGPVWSVYSRLRFLFPPVKPTVTPQKLRVFFTGTSSGEFRRFRRVPTVTRFQRVVSGVSGGYPSWRLTRAHSQVLASTRRVVLHWLHPQIRQI